MLPWDDQYVPSGKYIRPLVVSATKDPAIDIPSPSTSQAPSTNQLLLQILQRLDRQGWQMERIEHRNKRRFTYLKKLIVGHYPPKEDPETPDSTSPTSTGSHDDPDYGETATSAPLFLIDGTKDGAKL
ncbi:hypothetical protein AHAS_Ahas05G0051000 [Arachis hypogaea]